MGKTNARTSAKCGFCLAGATENVEVKLSRSKDIGSGEDHCVELFSSSTDSKTSICNRCVCFLQSLDNQTLGREEKRHKPYVNIDRVAYGVLRDPQDNGISFKCNYCSKDRSRLVFVAPGQDICIECIDHFNSH